MDFWECSADEDLVQDKQRLLIIRYQRFKGTEIVSWDTPLTQTLHRWALQQSALDQTSAAVQKIENLVFITLPRPQLEDILFDLDW